MIKLLIDEPETAQTQEAIRTAAIVATSTISYVEARAALARMRAGQRIGENAFRGARRDLDQVWLDLLSVPTDDELLATAADLADEHSLRGYDAVQLATAASLRNADAFRFVCWDAELNAAARSYGLALATQK